MRTTVKVRGKVNAGHVKKRYQAGRDKSLDRIGSFTRQSAKKQLGSNGPLQVKKKPKWIRVGERDGIPVLEATFRPPRPGKVTSWATKKNPTGFLRTAISYDRDDRRGSVLIGPEKRAVWLNKIQEFGGSRPVSLRLLSRRPLERLNDKAGGHKVPPSMGIATGSQRRNKRGRFMKGRNPQAYVVMRRDAATGRNGGSAGEFKREAGKVKPGRYMANGLEKVRPRIPKAFANFIQGP